MAAQWSLRNKSRTSEINGLDVPGMPAPYPRVPEKRYEFRKGCAGRQSDWWVVQKAQIAIITPWATANFAEALYRRRLYYEAGGKVY
jgi:hypothetical protein